MENVRKHRDTRLVTTDNTRSYLVSEPSQRIITQHWFSENPLAIIINKITVKTDKPI